MRQTTRAMKVHPLHLLLFLVLLSSSVFGKSSAKASMLLPLGDGNHPISWNPDRLELEVMQGVAQTLMVEMTSAVEVSSPTVFVTPSLTDVLSVYTAGLESIPAGQTGHLPITVQIPLTAHAGTYAGTIHVQDGNKTLSRPLQVKIRVIEPTSDSIPVGPSLPSSDRIGESIFETQYVIDELIVGLYMDTPDPAQKIVEIATATDGLIMGSVPQVLVYQLRYPQATSFEALQAIQSQLQTDPAVEVAAISHMVQPFVTYPNDTEYSDPWDQANPAGDNWHLETIKAPSAWDIQTGSSDVTIAILDWEFDDQHSDLNDNIASVTGTTTPSEGHGTHVAGLACAEGNNNNGVTGVAWDCTINAYDLGGPSTPMGFWPTLVDNMVKAVDDGARITNMSLGLTMKGGLFTTEEQRLQQVADANNIVKRGMLYAQQQGKDVLWVIAAGNDEEDTKFTTPASLSEQFPLNVITVAASNQANELSNFSNRGLLVTVAAPGGNSFLGFPSEKIFSTLPTGCFLFFFNCGDRYGGMAGTSQAAPQVTGLAALVLSEHPDFTSSEIKKCIVSGAIAGGLQIPGEEFYIINAEKAVVCEDTIDLPDEVDIVFALDLTGSMGQELARIKAEVTEIMQSLETLAPGTDFHFAVVSYEDYAGVFDSRTCGSRYRSTYGGRNDEPFRIDQSMTDDIDVVAGVVDGLTLGSGSDGPESYARVLWEIGQADTGADLGFRADALKLVVNFGDNIPHDTNLNEGFDPPLTPPFVQPDFGIDPGRDNDIDCFSVDADPNDGDIDFQSDALQALIDQDIRLLYIDSSENTVFIQAWQFWASQTGGAFAAIERDGTIPGDLDLAELIADLLRLIE